MKTWVDLLVEKAAKMNWVELATDGYCAVLDGKYIIIVHEDTVRLEENMGNMIDECETPVLLWSAVRARDERRIKAGEKVMKLLEAM